MVKATLLAAALALFVAGCASSHAAGLGHHDGGTRIGGSDQGGTVDTAAYVTACTQVDQALQYHDAAHRAPMLATVRKLNANPKTNEESVFLAAAAVVIEAEGIPNQQYSAQNKATLIKGCKQAGQPLKSLP